MRVAAAQAARRVRWGSASLRLRRGGSGESWLCRRSSALRECHALQVVRTATTQGGVQQRWRRERLPRSRGMRGMCSINDVAQGYTVDADSLPVTHGEFAACMEGLVSAAGAGMLDAHRPKVAVAVSGGPDSLALAALLRDWCLERGIELLALTVDHHLRDDSTREVATLTRNLDLLNISCQVLNMDWSGTGEPTASKLQVMAREKRYHMLQQACEQHGIRILFVAHTVNDNVETFVHRLARASGIKGLAAMQALTYRQWTPRLWVGRPLLDIPKARLIATCHARDLDFVVDPSNLQPMFDRVRVRQGLDLLHRNGVATPDLAQVVRHMQQRALLLEQSEDRLLLDAVKWVRFSGYAIVDTERLLQAHPSLVERALGRIMYAVGGRSHPPRMRTVRNLAAHIQQRMRGNFAGGGCLALRDPAKGATKQHRWWMVCRENPPQRRVAVAQKLFVPIRVDEPMLWDNRFVLRLKYTPPPGQEDVQLPRFVVERWGTQEYAAAGFLFRDFEYHFNMPAQPRWGLPVICIADPVAEEDRPAPKRSNPYKKLMPVARRLVMVPHIKYSLIPGLTCVVHNSPSHPLPHLRVGKPAPNVPSDTLYFE